MDKFYVRGSWGVLTANMQGNVLEYDSGEIDEVSARAEGYGKITRIDVEEWHSKYPGEVLAGDTVDILDVGYWEGEEYSEPEKDWREEVAKWPGLAKVRYNKER